MIRTPICLPLVVAIVSAVSVRAAVAQTSWEPRSLVVSDRVPRPTAKWEMATAANVAGLTLIAPSDVRLGMTRADALERLGRPGMIVGEVAEYVHEHNKWASLERLQQVRTANGLIVRFRQGVIDAIEVWKSTGPV